MKSILSFIFLIVFSLSTLNAQTIILTSDKQLEDLTDPDKKINNSIGYTTSFVSLREICEQAKRNGSKEINIAFDEFFRQYRPDTDTERRLTPDMDEYVDKIKVISDFVSTYDIGLCLSLLSPLELGQAYKNQTGECGHWIAFKTGLRDPESGRFSLQMWQQLSWNNNKGRTPVVLKDVRAYAFKEVRLTDITYVVEPDDIVPLDNVEYEIMGHEDGGVPMNRLRVYSDGGECAGYDRVMVLLEYETQELDYFSDTASIFLNNLMKKYADRGVNITSLYSDEMHIQQDWTYFRHQEEGQFSQLYFTESMARAYSEEYNQTFDERYLLYFVYGPHIYNYDTYASLNAQYVMSATPVGIHQTYLLRNRYYRMLNNRVVDLFNEAKHHAEEMLGHELRTSAHATWAESPTIDQWYDEKLTSMANQYEYTPSFVWSNTVHQAAAACYDYFKWGEYLQPTGNDYAECGWADRNYYGSAMAASLGSVNKYNNAYAAMWGMPDKVYERRMAINYAYGAQPNKHVRIITEGAHRDIEVLVVYPMNLVAVEPRFGSWMTQYGYANYLTSDKLVEMGEIQADGHVRVAQSSYGTIVVAFEPLPSRGLLDMLEQFVKSGGKVIWCSCPPLIDSNGDDCTAQWQRIFGAAYAHDLFMGEVAAGKKITFLNSLNEVPEQTVLTNYLVDHIYPVSPFQQTEIVATLDGKTVGTLVRNDNGGVACYCGFRPRDDQSASLGYETRTLFEMLNALNAYPATGNYDVNDNPSVLSRTCDYFVSRFPNNASMVTCHYRTHRETWLGGFSRNKEEDAAILQANPLPSDRVELDNMKINGHDVSYSGRLIVGFRCGDDGRLVAFYGQQCKSITIDGINYNFSETPINITFGPVDGNIGHYQVYIKGEGEITIPLPVHVHKAVLNHNGREITTNIRKGMLTFDVDSSNSGKWLDLYIN